MQIAPVSSINPLQLRRLGIDPNETGVVITGFSENAPESELAPGDLIKEINYVAINSIDDYRRFVEANKGKKSFIFKVKRQGQMLWVGMNA
ncbi:MAG TPA: PDZ domain-containing protein [Spirochaetota bacterium]|nr:PDZ domain-containing protein [Spirochaetota bacterium]